jgi:DNA-binding winged helix-turn-helix (wHTH) protein
VVTKEFARFRLDTVNQCLWRRRDTGDDERIALTPRAFGVLNYLVERAGRLVTQDELLETLWPQSYVQPEVLKHHVLEVRKALEDDPKKPLFIETLRRRGYRFIAPVGPGQGADVTSAAKSAQGRLVGRDAALSALRDCQSRALQGQRQVAFVTAEPGFGKTALIDEFQCHAVASVPGLQVALGQCVEGFGSKESYYPMLEALGQLCRGPGGEAIIDILATQAPTWLVQFPALLKREHRELLRREIQGATRERMLREIGDALETITARRPLLLIFEDLQWVDHSTVDLLSALARGRTPVMLMLVATKRPLDLLSRHPLAALKQDLLVHRLCREITLEPLGVAEVSEYLTLGSSGADLPKGLAGLIHRHSEGNPLFMVAALEHLTRRGLISRENERWQLTVPLEKIGLEVPENLRQMIEAQIESLSLNEQRALEVASVAGAAFSARACAEAVGARPDDFEDLYESVAHRHRMVRRFDPDDPKDAAHPLQYEFVHALYREVLYQRQPSGRRAKLHRSIGARLEALCDEGRDQIAAELAHHLERGSDWTRAVKYLRLAADAAERRCGHSEAIALLERALEVTARLPETERIKSEIEVLEKLASIYYFSLDVRAPNMYEALASRAARCGAIDIEMRAVMEMAMLWSVVDSQRSLELMDRVVRLGARLADPLARAGSQLSCAYWRILAGGWNDEVAAAGRAAFAEIRQAGDRTALGPHLVWYGGLLMLSSEYRESRRHVLEGLALMSAGSDENPCANLAQASAVFILFLDSLLLGEWGQALREIDAGIAAMARNANDIFAHGWRIQRSVVSVHAMDFAGVLSICESAARALGDSMPRPAGRIRLAMVGAAEAGLGQHERALEHLTLGLAEMERQMVCIDWWCGLYMESALTELWIDKGALPRARTQGERFLHRALATADRTFQCWAWESSARIAMMEGDRERARECIARALSTMEGFEVPLAGWRVHATAAALDEMAGNGKSAKHHLELSRSTILKLADSLAADQPLRKTFLSAPSVSRILRDV